MENLIREIIISAQGLDNRGMHKESKILDDIADSLIMVKQAQYDGTQGYFVRNTRCWNGCFREKRARGMTSNEAWEFCHHEWLKSNSEGSSDSWDKYAGDTSLNKTASCDEKISMAADEALSRAIDDRIKSGLSFEESVPMTLAERSISIAVKLSNVSESLYKMASEINIAGTAETINNIADKLSEMSSEEYLKSLIE